MCTKRPQDHVALSLQRFHLHVASASSRWRFQPALSRLLARWNRLSHKEISHTCIDRDASMLQSLSGHRRSCCFDTGLHGAVEEDFRQQNTSEAAPGTSPGRSLESWLTFLWSFTPSDPTFPLKDRLRAAEEVIGSTLHGHPEDDDFIPSLLWESAYSSTHLRSWPSWSWCFRDGALDFTTARNLWRASCLVACLNLQPLVLLGRLLHVTHLDMPQRATHLAMLDRHVFVSNSGQASA